MTLVFRHGQGLGQFPGTHHIQLTDDSQSFAQSQLWRAYLDAYSLLVFRRGAQLTLARHDAVREGGTIHKTVLGDVQPVVVHRIECSLLCSHFQTMGNGRPLVAQLVFAAYHAVVIVDVCARLHGLGHFTIPVGAVGRHHLVLRNLGAAVFRQDVDDKVLAECGVILQIE